MASLLAFLLWYDRLTSSEFIFTLTILQTLGAVLAVADEDPEKLKDSLLNQGENTEENETLDEDEEVIEVKSYKYVLVGGGPASYNAMKEILFHEPGAEVCHYDCIVFSSILFAL